MAKLIVVTPDGEQREYSLRAINTLGRHPEQTVQILDRVVSKEHALVTYADSSYWLQDIGSRNGTFVNGNQVHGRTRLKDGDTISLGSTQIYFMSQDTGTDSLGYANPKNITIHATTTTDTAIRSRVQANKASQTKFLPESELASESTLRSDYEKLRVVFELNQAIGSETNPELILQRILEKAFEFSNADRGVILLLDEDGVPRPQAYKNRRDNEEKIELSQTILNEVMEHHHAVLSSDATMDSRFGGSHSIIMQGIRSTMCVPLMTGDEIIGMIHLDTRIAIGVFTEKDLQVLAVFANQAATKIANARLARQAEAEAVVRNNLSRLLSPNLVDEVVKGAIAMEKGGELRKATVLFLDIRGYTTMSGGMDAQDMVSLLNEYFEIMVDIVFRHEGTLDKFIGDGLMAVWGAPVHQDNHFERAALAALEMMRALDDWNRFRVANDAVPIKAGAGLNCGELVAGYMGSNSTLSYTVIGDVVNTAARLCDRAKPGQILFTTPILEALEGRLEYQDIETARLKGMRDEVPIFQLQKMK